MLYCVDREGWVGIYKDALEVENSLESIDVMSNEYIIIDHSGALFAAYESAEGPRGFRIRTTGAHSEAALRILRKCSDDSQLEAEDLSIVRSI